MFEERRIARLRRRIIYLENRQVTLADGTAERWTGHGNERDTYQRIDIVHRARERAWQKYEALMTRLHGPDVANWPKWE